METVRESEIGTATWEAFHFGWNPHAHTQSVRMLAEMLRREHLFECSLLKMMKMMKMMKKRDVVWDFVCCAMNHVLSLQC